MQLFIHFLGTGGSWPSVARNVSAIAIKRGGEILLFDCGEGTQRQLQKSALSYMQIKKIFITHFHGDHFLGLPGLFQTFQLNDREEPLHIYGPPGIKALVNQLVHLGYFAPAYEILSHELQGGDAILFEGYAIKCMFVNHSVPTLSYSLEENMRPGRFNKRKALKLGVPEGPLFRRLQRGEKVEVDGKSITPKMVLGEPRPGRKITISGDTVPCNALISFAEKSDVLIHDATLDSSFKGKANEYGHSTVRQAGEIAKKARIEKLFLTHISPRYKNTDVLEKDAREVFPNAFVTYDFMEVEVKLKK